MSNDSVVVKKTRRHWPVDVKSSIMAESDTNGVSPTARKYGILPRLLFSWRKQRKETVKV